MATPLALILDCESGVLRDDERDFFKAVQPFGFILFERHCDNPQQLKALVDDLRACVSHADAPVFIDQEGGRVARMKPPQWDEYPPAKTFGDRWRQDHSESDKACYLNARLMGHELQACGINGNCAPLADLWYEQAHDIIGDRSFGHEPGTVVTLARAQAQGLLESGVFPVLKHIPGHGRALADSHLELPVVDAPLSELERSDFLPFKQLHNLPFGMTAHVTYTALDADAPVTLSKKAIDYIRHEIGFTKLLMSDDISMKALKGDLADNARKTLDAGCDLVLLCNASLQERKKVAAACAPMPPERYAVFEREAKRLGHAPVIDRAVMKEERDQLM